MRCPYCRSVNENADERCSRCGRRLHAANPRPAPELLVRGAAAPELRPPADPLPQPVPEPVNYQPSLFRDGSAPKVVPIPTLTPMRPVERQPANARRTPVRTPAHRQRRVNEAQQAFELQEYTGEVQTRPEEKIYCDAPVASPQHRALAAIVDGGLVLAGAGLILLAALIPFGNEMVLTRTTLLVVASVVAAVYVLYRALWAIANGDTPGMRFAGLRLVDFDGRSPRRDRRIVRQVAGLLSILSVGLGLVWALVDEESLTWHDHISKTFPTVM